MSVTAKSKYLKTSAQKLRLSADLVRGKRVVEAMDILRYTNKKSADLVFAALKSAAANAENNHNMNMASLVITDIRADTGPKLRRMRPRSRGMANPIFHPMSHLTVTVDERKDVAQIAKAVPKTVNKPVQSAPTKKETK